LTVVESYFWRFPVPLRKSKMEKYPITSIFLLDK